MNEDKIRVRIAPSPTGTLHIGTVRTALFNYLYARHHQGTMIVRIEDTDQERSKDEYTQDILAGFKKLGLDWDEGPEVEGDFGPYFQTKRFDLYEQALNQLLEKGSVYPCYFDDEIKADREKAQANNENYTYQGQYRDRDPADKIAAGVQPVYRLKNPNQKIVFNDMVRGEVKFDSALNGDMIIARSDKSVLYNFAVVVDDALMKITHVIRGEDHISNTPKQILIYQALGYDVPTFAHTAMMLAPDRSKLSKRHGATAIADYLKQGFLPEALINYMALLGWSPPEGQELFSLKELIQHFSFDKVNKSGAVFDREKLTWLNGQWIRKLSSQELLKRLKPFYTEANLQLENRPEEWLEQMVQLVQEKIALLPDAVEQSQFLFEAQLKYNPEEVDKALIDMKSAPEVLSAFAQRFADLSNWEKEGINQAFQEAKQALKETYSSDPRFLSEKKGKMKFDMKKIMWPLRAALTGSTSGPDLMTGIELLGKASSCQRLEEAQRYIIQHV